MNSLKTFFDPVVEYKDAVSARDRARATVDDAKRSLRDAEAAKADRSAELEALRTEKTEKQAIVHGSATAIQDAENARDTEMANNTRFDGMTVSDAEAAVQTDLDQAVQDLTDRQAEADAAQETLASAEADVNVFARWDTADQTLSDAQTASTSAQQAATDAANAESEARTDRDQKSTAKNDASIALETAKDDVEQKEEDLQAAKYGEGDLTVEEAQAALDQAKTASASAESAHKNAVAALKTAREALDAAVSTRTAADDEAARKKTAREEARGTLDAVTIEKNNLSMTRTEADDALTSAKSAAESADSALSAAKTAKEAAEAIHGTIKGPVMERQKSSAADARVTELEGTLIPDAETDLATAEQTRAEAETAHRDSIVSTEISDKQDAVSMLSAPMEDTLLMRDRCTIRIARIDSAFPKEDPDSFVVGFMVTISSNGRNRYMDVRVSYADIEKYEVSDTDGEGKEDTIAVSAAWANLRPSAAKWVRSIVSQQGLLGRDLQV